MISLEEAQHILLENIKSQPVEEVSIWEADNRVLAEVIHAPIDSPPFDKSPLDGYAVRSCDLSDVSKEGKIFEIIDRVYAGEVSKKIIGENEVIRIMTGAPIPQGADCIVKQELTEKVGNNKVNIFVSHKKNENIIFRGEDFKKGSKVIDKDILLKSSTLMAIASLGIDTIKVYKRPVVGILTTGDEIQNPGEELREGKIFNSNKIFLCMRLKELGAIPKLYDSVEDSKEELTKVIATAEKECDLIVSTGGVSVGEKDLVQDAVRSLGYEILFWKVDMKPGSPMFAGCKNGKLYIGLTGTPVAAATTFELTVRRLVARMMNSKELDIKKVAGIIQDDFSKSSNKRRFLRAKIELDIENRVYINNIYQSPGQINTMINSNAILEVKPGTALKVGDRVEVII